LLPYYAAVIALFPLASLLFSNAQELSLWAVVISLCLAIIIAESLYLVLFALIKDRARAGAMTAALLFFFFSYGQFSNIMNRVSVFGFSFIRNRYRAVVYTILFIVTLFSIRKFPGRQAGGKKWLDGISVALTILLIGQFGMVMSAAISRPVKEEPARLASRDLEGVNDPDIYHFILDGYAGPSTLDIVYGYHDPFISSLKEKGFIVAEQCCSNYPMTSLSLTSTQGMGYFTDRPEFERLRSGQINQDILRVLGYRIINVAAVREGLNKNKDIDLLYLVLRMSALDMIAHRFNLYARFARANINNAYVCLEQSINLEGPKYVYAHIMAPHPPFVFRRNGSPNKLFDPGLQGDLWKTSWDDKQGYLEQLIYIANKTDQVVDKIIAGSKERPIILIQSDHGPQFIEQGDYYYLKRMAILCAYLLPKNGRIASKPIRSPVNLFRLIFSAYFDLDYPLLPDKYYFSYMEKPFNLTDVTMEINREMGNYLERKNK